MVWVLLKHCNRGIMKVNRANRLPFIKQIYYLPTVTGFRHASRYS